MAADPLRSEGARLERKAVREYLRRRLRAEGGVDKSLERAIAWILTREERYNARPGGLGRKRR